MNDPALNVLTSTSATIGEMLLQNNKPLLKMWNVSVNSGARLPVNHSHSRFEIAVCVDGSGEYSTDIRLYDILPGDVFVFSANEQHCITGSGPEGLRMINLHFEPRYLLADGGGADREGFVNFCFSHSREFENRIPCVSSQFLRNALIGIKNEFSHNDNNQYVAIRSYLNLILIELLRNHKYQTESLIENKKGFEGLLAVYDHIDAHLCEKLRLDELAGIAGFSPNYFSHVFKKLNGISLWDYITARRVEKAARLLVSGSSGFSMLDIALECGFNNTVNFNKAFKKQKGATPREYRSNRELHFH